MSIISAVQQFTQALADAHRNHAECLAGVTHWEGQIAKLTAAKVAIDGIFPESELSVTPPATPGAKKATAKPAKSGGKVEMPSTDKAFWMGLLTATPQKTGELLQAACDKLEVIAPEKIELLKGRLGVFLQNAAKAKEIGSEGERMNRTYTAK